MVQFEGKDDSTKKRIVLSTLGKNPAFTRLPSGSIGLSEWYPNAKRDKKPRSTQDQVNALIEAGPGSTLLPNGEVISADSEQEEPASIPSDDGEISGGK